MELKNFFTNSSNETYEQNMDLLEDYDLIHWVLPISYF